MPPAPSRALRLLTDPSHPPEPHFLVTPQAFDALVHLTLTTTLYRGCGDHPILQMRKQLSAFFWRGPSFVFLLPECIPVPCPTSSLPTSVLSSTLDQAPPAPPALLPLAGAWLAVGGDVQRAPVYFRPCAWLLSGPLALSLAGRSFCCLFIVPRFLLQLSRKENKAQSHTRSLGGTSSLTSVA